MLSAIFYIYILVELTLFFLLSCVALVVCFPFDKPRRVVHELSRAICLCFWLVPPTWRRSFKGFENADKKTPYVIAINHNSMADILALYFLRMNFRWVSKREVFRMPYIGPLLSIHGDIAIDRGRGAESMKKVIDDGKLWVSRGVSIAIFPEGTRSKNGEIHRFKQGAFVLAKEAGVAILPVVMDGTRDVLKKNWMFNWRNHLKISVLKPLSAEEVAATDAGELAVKVQQMMTEELARIRAER
ncbi:MAG: 1-acyl-sn-glycerol-3-phosphate acyltransferase [Alistipes sp.]|nr:1-acyl-sn-glycerol-3-phosphate acyltransferase [Alistipes sp.]